MGTKRFRRIARARDQKRDSFCQVYSKLFFAIWCVIAIEPYSIQHIETQTNLHAHKQKKYSHGRPRPMFLVWEKPTHKCILYTHTTSALSFCLEAHNAAPHAKDHPAAYPTQHGKRTTTSARCSALFTCTWQTEAGTKVSPKFNYPQMLVII